MSMMFLDKELPEWIDLEPIGLAGSVLEFKRIRELLPGISIEYGLSEDPPYKHPMMVNRMYDDFWLDLLSDVKDLLPEYCYTSFYPRIRPGLRPESYYKQLSGSIEDKKLLSYVMQEYDVEPLCISLYAETRLTPEHLKDVTVIKMSELDLREGYAPEELASEDDRFYRFVL